jgi:hypothetical protein
VPRTEPQIFLARGPPHPATFDEYLGRLFILTRQSDGQLHCAIDEHVIAPFSKTFSDLSPHLASAEPFGGDQWVPVDSHHSIFHSTSHSSEVIWQPHANAAAAAKARAALSNGSAVRIQNGPLMKQFRGTQRVQLGDSGFLDAYSIFDQGAPTSKRLRYVRYDPRFHPVCDVMLNAMHIA